MTLVHVTRQGPVESSGVVPPESMMEHLAAESDAEGGVALYLLDAEAVEEWAGASLPAVVAESRGVRVCSDPDTPGGAALARWLAGAGPG